mgnify:CR=1 FL=1
MNEAEQLGFAGITGQHRPAAHGVRAADRAAPVRSQARQAAPGRGRLPERLRRGRPHAQPALLLDGRSDRRQPRRRRHPHARAHDGARRVPRHLGREEAARHRDGRAGRRRQRGHAHRGRSRPRKGATRYGVLPEVEDLFQRQARELDRKKREEMLHQIQKILQRSGRYSPRSGRMGSFEAWDRRWRSRPSP